jgi:hypothetical protein
MTFQQFRMGPYAPFEILDKLVEAGLGDVPQCDISRAEYDAAMRGEVARPPSRQEKKPTKPPKKKRRWSGFATYTELQEARNARRRASDKIRRTRAKEKNHAPSPQERRQAYLLNKFPLDLHGDVHASQ